MTSTDWIIDIALILLVVRQMREGRLDLRFFLLPLGLVGYTFSHYISGLPTGGNDLVVVAVALLAGCTLGAAGGLLTRVRGGGGVAYARAGSAAAALWIASMTARLGFIVWITHSSGQAALGRFSVAHDITGAQVWQTSLLVLALSEVLVRLGVIAVRGHRARTASLEAPVARERVLVAA